MSDDTHTDKPDNTAVIDLMIDTVDQRSRLDFNLLIVARGLY